jgi:arsenate reductase
VEPRIVDYVKTPPSAGEIRTVLKELGLKARALLRRRGTPYDALGLDDPKLSDAALIAAMARHPILIERPVVRGKKGTRLCRPPERVKDIL